MEENIHEIIMYCLDNISYLDCSILDVGSMIIGFLENILMFIDWAKPLSIIGFNPSQALQIPTGYKLTIVFVILLVVFMFFPTGLLRAPKGK